MRLSVTVCIAALSSVALADTAKPTPAQAPPASAPTRVAAPCMMRGVKDMGCVPGGVFLRGSNRGPKSTRPQAEVWIDTFYMDATEVTVAAYDACVARGACEKARTIYEDYSRPRQPKVGVSWQHAD
nr:SUMF1/EgtB/PvdO family nonheme iron enzyme [Polyangiaceae bacterium]